MAQNLDIEQNDILSMLNVYLLEYDPYKSSEERTYTVNIAMMAMSKSVRVTFFVV